MKNARRLILPVMAILQSGMLQAASFSGSPVRESLVTADNLDWLGVGFSFQQSKRDVSFERTRDEALFSTLEARSIDTFISADVRPWLTVFATIGTSSVLESEPNDYGAFRLKWSAGLNFNVWHYDIFQPNFMAGRLCFNPTLEFAKHTAEDVGIQGNKVEWSDITLAAPICYELFEDKPPQDDPSLRKSFNIYLGPAVSLLDGSVEYMARDRSFDEDQRFGIIGGVDAFLAERLSVGAQVLLFDRETVTATIRYHF